MTTSRHDIRLSEALAERIDRWRGQQPGIPSRTKAVQALVEAALAMLEKSERTAVSD